VRDRLAREYLDTAAKIFESGSAAPDMTSAQWKQATNEVRAASKAALEAFHRHRKEQRLLGPGVTGNVSASPRSSHLIAGGCSRGNPIIGRHWDSGSRGTIGRRLDNKDG
jgi:hypothetical protein